TTLLTRFRRAKGNGTSTNPRRQSETVMLSNEPHYGIFAKSGPHRIVEDGERIRACVIGLPLF
nr:hypothetical protein [Roseovarius sp.]